MGMSRPSEAERVTSLAFYGAVLLVAFLAYRIVEPFLGQIGWAIVLAICLAPAQARLAPRLGPTRTAALLTTLVLLLLVVPALVAVAMLVREGPELVAYVDGQLRDRGGPMGLFHVAWQWLHARAPFLPTEEEIVERLTSSLGGLASEAASRAGAIVKGAVSFAFGLVITLGILFFLLRDGPEMTRAARRLLPFGREQNERLRATSCRPA
jgi:predicted PurR-regulated permease PerM